MKKLTDLQLLVLEKEAIHCSDVEELMDDYVEEELPVTLRARLDGHVAECEYCQEIEQGYRLTIELAAELGRNPQPVPTGVQNRLRKTLNERLGLDLPLVE